MKRFVNLVGEASLCVTVGLLLVGCGGGDSNKKKDDAQSEDAVEATPIALGKSVEFVADAEPLDEAISNYGYMGTKSYKLSLTEDMTIELEESMSSTACLEGSEARGPFFTLAAPGDDFRTTDKVQFTEFAVADHELQVDLDKGEYNVYVSFFATGEQCTGMLEFTVNGTPVEANEDEGEDGDVADSADPDQLGVDSLVVGDWELTDSESGFEVKQVLKISDAGDVLQTVFVNDELFLEQKMQATFWQSTGYRRVKLELTEIVVDASEDSDPVGTTLACIYHVVEMPKQLQLSCGANQTAFPQDLSEASVFAPSTNDPNLPTLPDQAIVKTYTDLNLSIPDDVAAGVVFEMPVVEDVLVKDVVVSISIAHTYVSDLVVTLISPSGTEVILHQFGGGSGDELVATYGTDGAMPVGDLTAFLDESSKGTWLLHVSDQAQDDVGLLRSVSLELAH